VTTAGPEDSAAKLGLFDFTLQVIGAIVGRGRSAPRLRRHPASDRVTKGR
jgi:hypothetical protein